jgi:dienelactone hydrolase
MPKIYLFLLIALITSCLSTKKATNSRLTNDDYGVRLDSLELFDSGRNRKIPVALYLPVVSVKIKNQKLIIVNHGYDQNKSGSNKEYSYLTEKLAAKGYFVASIQHELPTDDLLPKTGVPQVVRLPMWTRGVENILFVLNNLKKAYPELDFKHLTLLGHSNGGDMSMLFATKYPKLVDKVISLDNRRVAFPRTKQPKIYSLRSIDQVADDGVLPSAEEQKMYGIKIIMLPNTIHNDMDNNASELQRKEINDYVMGFLRD